MKYVLTLLLFISASITVAQVSDNFSDGNFSSNPTWTGDVADFDASAFNLHLDAAAAGDSYLSTAQTELGETTWEFLVHFDFNPSSTSLAKVYLVSDQADLTGSLNGYFVMVGDAADEVSLYKQDGSTETYVINGTDDVVDASTVNVRVRVTRDASGQWSLFHDVAGGTSYTQEGSATTETSFTSTSHFGVFCQYIDSRKNAIYFDDFSVSTATSGFALSSITKEGDNGIRLAFNQNVDQTSAETTSNYTLNFGFGNPTSAVRDLTNLDEVLLTFSTNFVNNDYTLNIDQVQNQAADETISDLDQAFDVELQTPFRDIVINEIMADPSPVVGLPNAEYLELYNTSDQAINLGDFMIDARIVGDFALESGAYVTLTTAANAGLFTGDVIGLSGLSLSNSGEALQLTDNLGNLVDSVSYTSDWYNDTDKDDGGYALEQINPELACSYENNWTASSHADGGTPGVQNSVFNNSPDVTGPNLIDFIATDANTFLLTFDESMDETSLNDATYAFDQGIAENGITPNSPGFFSTSVDVTPDLSSGIEYTVTITGATDCAGNGIQTNSLSFAYDTNPPALDRIVVRTADKIDVIFNEDLNETIAETESNYSSDHSGSNPTSALLDNDDASMVSLTFSDAFQLDVENTLTISNLQDLQGNALSSSLTPTFTLTQQIDTVRVMGINLLDLYFTQSLDPVSAGTEGNYAVDDGVGSPSVAFVDDTNDQLVHLIFARNFDDNKDLTLSTTNIQNTALDYLTTPDVIFVYDTSPPKLDTVKVISSSTLEVVFREKVEEQSAESLENYEYADFFPIQADLQADQQTVILEFAETFEREVIFELSIDEVKDLYENEIKTKLKQEFVYDVFEPELDSITVRSADQLILWFNENVDETTAENTSNYSIGSGIGEPDLATLDLEFQNRVYLDLSPNLPESAGIALDISLMTDQRNNSITSAISSTFDYDVFYVSRIKPLGRNSLEIEFNKVPQTLAKTTLANYSLKGQSPQSIIFSSDRTGELNFDADFEDNSSNSLSVENIVDVNTNAISVTEYTFDFDSRIASALPVGDRTIALEFEVELDVGQSLTLADFNSSPSLGNCVAAVIDNEEPHLLRLTFEETLVADQTYSVSWQNLVNVYGNDLPDYFISVINDETPPVINEHQVLDSRSVWLKYSEPLNETSAEFLNNYQIDTSIGYPIEATYTSSDSSVVLEFSAEFVEGTAYTLSINNIEDLSDNALLDTDIQFTYEATNLPSFGDLIITEIMADPTPEVALSDAEYIELYNPTAELITLAGVRLVDEGGSTTLVSGEIESGGYIVLTGTSNTGDFPKVDVLGVSSFPSLSNGGETISLYAGESQIFSTSYTSDWYRDDEKAAGGWSLEMIDVENPCGEAGNWAACTDERGGTPGVANAASTGNPDNFGPQLIEVIALDEDSLLIRMNEKLHPDQFASAQLTINPEIAIVSQGLIQPENINIGLQLGQTLETGQLYELSILMVSDCRLNMIQSDFNSGTFRLPEQAEVQDLVINEVLFNPRSGGVDFVELYNNSEKAVNLKNWVLTDELNNPKVITEEELIFNPSEYLVLTPDPSILSASYPDGDASTFYAVSDFPGLSDAEDSVILINSEAIIVDQMEYLDDYHFNLLDDDEGVSLERIAFDAESFNPDSWKSAASTVGFATPGKLNSQFSELNQTQAVVSIEPRVFIPDNTGMNDFTTISYQLDQAGNFANVHIYSVNGVLTKTLAEGALLSTRGLFTWDGLANDGSRASVGYYVVHFEIFDGQGNRSIQKETVVLGARF